jgi:hypothetical protein
MSARSRGSMGRITTVMAVRLVGGSGLGRCVTLRAVHVLDPGVREEAHRCEGIVEGSIACGAGQLRRNPVARPRGGRFA